MASNDDGGSFITGFLVGGIVGALVGILLAPKAGSETRSDLLDRGELLRERAEELGVRVRERVGPTVEVVGERVVPAVESVRERVGPAVEVGPVADRVSSRVRRGADASESDGVPAVEETAEPAAEA